MQPHARMHVAPETAVPFAEPGAAAWLKLEPAPLRRLGPPEPRRVVIAGIAWEGRPHTVSVDPVIVAVVAVELALVGLGLLGKLALLLIV